MQPKFWQSLLHQNKIVRDALKYGNFKVHSINLIHHEPETLPDGKQQMRITCEWVCCDKSCNHLKDE